MDSDLLSYLQEKTQHGDTDFPVAYYHCCLPEDFRDMPLHWHPEMEFTLVREGELDYNINTVPLRVEAGDILLIPPDTLHGTHKALGYAAVTDSIVFHLNYLGLERQDSFAKRYLVPLMARRVEFDPVIRPGTAEYDALYAAFCSLWKNLEERPACFEIALKQDFLQLIPAIYRLAEQESVTPALRENAAYESKLKLALAYIQNHYAENITIAQLAELCGFSQVHFMNIFKKALGCTCIEYVNEYRIAVALVRLRDTEDSVMQIAMDAGFQNISYFNRLFRKREHMTPLECRKRYRAAHNFS